MKPTVTPILRSIIPNFILEDHPGFVDFIEAYYEWLENEGGALYQINQHKENIDIDTTTDLFIESFRKTFLVNFPQNTAADQKTLIKNVLEYYRARGTEKSFRLFFRILFNQECDFYYPREDILRVSDGKWIQKKTLRVTAISGNQFNFSGKRIISKKNNTTAFIEEVQKVQVGPYEIYELFLNSNSISGFFSINEEICDYENPNLKARIQSLPQKINIIDGGFDYTVGQKLNILDGPNGVVRGTVKIDLVNNFGSIEKVSIFDFGGSYFNKPFVDTSDSGTISVDSRAELDVLTGSIATYPGYFKNNDGFLSTSKFLHDGRFYQQFSYQTILDESLSSYKNILLKELHPTGLSLFGAVRIQNQIKSTSIISNQRPFPHFEVISCKELDINNNENFNVDSEIVNIVESEKSFISESVGPTLNSLERDKFYYKPYQGYNYSLILPINNDIPPTTSEFVEIGEYPITPIEYFENLKISDFENKFNKIIATPDSIILNIE